MTLVSFGAMHEAEHEIQGVKRRVGAKEIKTMEVGRMFREFGVEH